MPASFDRALCFHEEFCNAGDATGCSKDLSFFSFDRPVVLAGSTFLGDVLAADLDASTAGTPDTRLRFAGDGSFWHVECWFQLCGLALDPPERLTHHGFSLDHG